MVIKIERFIYKYVYIHKCIYPNIGHIALMWMNGICWNWIELVIELKKKSVRIIHYPRLDTVLMVEDLLKKSEAVISRNEIMRRLPKKMIRQTLNVILYYLEDSGKVYISKKGVSWVWHEDISPTLQKKLNESVKIERVENEKRD